MVPEVPDETLTYPLPLRRRSIPERLRRAAQQITEIANTGDLRDHDRNAWLDLIAIAVTIESTADEIEEHTP